MKKIDWYILKKFLVTFFFCMLMFTVVAVAVDTSEKTDDFVKTGLGTWQIIRQYYFGFVPFIWSLLFPLFVFIAVIFFTSRMATRSEIIAILASGTSYNRILRPYLIGGLLLSAMLWFGSRYLIPKANVIRSDFFANYIDKDKSNHRAQGEEIGRCVNCFYRRIDNNTYVGLKNYDTSTMSSNTFFLDRVKDNKIIYNLRATYIQWDKKIKKWKLSNVIERVVDSMHETTRQVPTMTLDIKLDPSELINDEFLKDKLTTPELSRFIEREEQRGTEGLNAYKVEQYRRTATAITVLLLTFIGVVIASRRTRGGSGMHLALGIIIAASFVISDRFSTVFATKGNLPPLLAAWLPNIAFSIVAYLLYRRSQK